MASKKELRSQPKNCMVTRRLKNMKKKGPSDPTNHSKCDSGVAYENSFLCINYSSTYLWS